MLTEEGFRRKVRESKPEYDETVFQYIARLSRYFERWIEMAEAEPTYESLSDLLIREQFVGTCSPELALFLKERMPKSLTDVTTLAEQYIEANGGSITTNKGPKNGAPNKTGSQKQKIQTIGIPYRKPKTTKMKMLQARFD